ncbi:MAG: LicD family protein [Candidatus Methanofastidiosum sp.]|nr:LicD family protein [Methanofastidiosum sp.]
MHIFKIQLHDFQEICRTVIEDLDMYGIEETCFNDSLITKVPAEINVDQSYHINRYKFKLSKSEILNYVVHRFLWNCFLEMNIPWCMIIESNVNINASIKKIISTINSIPEEWDVFFPYDAAEFHESDKMRHGMFLLNPNIREAWENEPFLMGFQWSNSCYFISKQGAKKLMQVHKIRERLDDTLLSLSFNDRLNVYTETVKWFDYSDIVQWEYPGRKKILWDTIIKESSWTSIRKARIQSILAVISKIANDLNIDLILQGGTHLGYIRHGGIMPWDDDVDLGIEEKSVSPFFKSLKEYGKGFCLGSFLEPGTNCLYYKVWNEIGESISNYIYTFPFVDIWIYNRIKNDLIFKNGIICKNSAKQDFISVSFEKSKFKIPYNSIDVLDTRYTNWKTKIKVYRYCHRLEKPAFSLLSLSIKVNEEGRLLI